MEVIVSQERTKLLGTIWNQVPNPVGVVQIISGLDNNIEMYDAFAKFLNQNGYIVFCSRPSTHTPDTDPDIFMATVRDEITIMKQLKQNYDLPVFLFGHSYGSFITQRIMQNTELCAAGVCLSGTAKFPLSLLITATTLSWAGKKLFGAATPARIVERIGPMRHARHKTQSPKSWGFYYSLFHNLMQLKYESCATTPLLIIGGNDDLVSLNSHLATTLFRTYQAHDLENLTVIIYPAPHDKLLYDANCASVQRDILEFLNINLMH